MSFKCPTCERPLYNRRRDACEFCGGFVPYPLRLTKAQLAKIERMKREEDQRHRASMRRIPHTGKDMSFTDGDVWAAGLDDGLV